MSTVLQGANAINCSPYPSALASSCSPTNQRSASFRDLDNQLSDASSFEHTMPFVVNTTMGLYTFLHPCATNAEAALKLFYDEHSPVPDKNSSWWGEMSIAMLGRRRRAATRGRHHYLSENDLLISILQQLLHDTGNDAGCVQYLIEKYRANDHDTKADYTSSNNHAYANDHYANYDYYDYYANNYAKANYANNNANNYT
ncbi:uncharacterized protein LOC143298640 [Babylonia areolata]|uniref:uncharacterized protein LOC143298640 n=1 Tax=Babylonia areolata TaxID=304850 RepID=UPI003FD31075